LFLLGESQFEKVILTTRQLIDNSASSAEITNIQAAKDCCRKKNSVRAPPTFGGAKKYISKFFKLSDKYSIKLKAGYSEL